MTKQKSRIFKYREQQSNQITHRLEHVDDLPGGRFGGFFRVSISHISGRAEIERRMVQLSEQPNSLVRAEVRFGFDRPPVLDVVEGRRDLGSHLNQGVRSSASRLGILGDGDGNLWAFVFVSAPK